MPCEDLHKNLTALDLHYARIKVGSGDPSGVVDSSIAGELYVDYETMVIWYSTGTTNTSWVSSQGSNSFKEMNCISSIGVNDLVYISGNDTVSKAGKEIGITADALVIAKPTSTTCLITFGSYTVSGLSFLGLGVGGDRIYLGDSTSTPNITNDPDPDMVQEVGKLINANEANINIDQSEIV